MSDPVHVFWLNLHPNDCRPRETWDVQLLQSAMDGTLWPSVDLPEFEHHEGPDPLEGMTGGIVLVNGGFHAKDSAKVNERLQQLEWAIVYITSDEASTYPHESLVLPQRHTLTISTPRPDRTYPPRCRFMGEGWPPDTPAMVAEHGNRDRPTDVLFCGQLGHSRRAECWAALEALAEDRPDLEIVGAKTKGFAQGYDRAEYLKMMTEAKVVLCPSGPRTPDSFRAYEAMEAGCAVILDQTAPGYPARGFWPKTLPGSPAPLIGDWADLPKYVDAILSDWPRTSAAIQAHWIAHKRWMVTQLADDLRAVGGIEWT